MSKMLLTQNKTISELLDTLPQIGKVIWISIRPERNKDVKVATSVHAKAGKGLIGDHYSGRSGKREVTLIQEEHIEAVASFLKEETLNPALLRRNIVVKGINLLALKDKSFQIGEATLEYSGLCHPCSRMEQNLGQGGYNAMRGQGGITARILEGGMIKIGDAVKVITEL